MSWLNKDQIQLIEADVENARLVLENLAEEITDHLCCEVEKLMESGKSFQEAYQIVKQQTGIDVLRKIQEDTLYLIDKNYRIMKTTMKITGNISLIMLGLGTLFKIFHWPGAGVMLVAGFMLLCILFFPLFIYLQHQEGGTKGKTLMNASVLSGGVAYMAGVLFKVQHWPGASELLLAGTLIILFLFVPMLLFVQLKKNRPKREKRVYILGAIAIVIFELSSLFKIFHWPGAGPLMLLGSLLLIGLFLPIFSFQKIKQGSLTSAQFIFIITFCMQAIILTSLMSMNVSRQVLSRFVSEEKNHSTLARYYREKNRETRKGLQTDSLHSTTLDSLLMLSQNAEELSETIQKIKKELIIATEKTDDSTAKTIAQNPELINLKDNYDIVNVIMLFKNNGSNATLLKKQLDEFRQLLCMLSADAKGLPEKISLLLSTSAEGINGKTSTWEETSFKNNPLISTLALLSCIENKVRIAESEVLNYHLNYKH
jgi:hypothetical protein